MEASVECCDFNYMFNMQIDEISLGEGSKKPIQTYKKSLTVFVKNSYCLLCSLTACAGVLSIISHAKKACIYAHTYNKKAI